MRHRSWLFVPGDAPSKLDKALGAGADVVILDLEDSVAEARKPEARRLVADFLRVHPAPRPAAIFVRINPLSTPHALADLAAVVSAAPDGIVLPKPDSAADATRLDHYLSALEAASGLPAGRIRILPIATETPRALFTLDSYQGASPRLAALTWGAEDLPAAVPPPTAAPMAATATCAGSPAPCAWAVPRRQACHRSRRSTRTSATPPAWRPMPRAADATASSACWRSTPVRCRSSTPCSRRRLRRSTTPGRSSPCSRPTRAPASSRSKAGCWICHT